jgi:O-antigen/teichoic acid export membrane protein
MAETTSKKVLALSFGQTLTAIVAIISGMVASRLLSVGDYAIMRQTFLAYEFLAPFLTMGLPVVLYYYLPKPNINKRKVILETIIILIVLGLLLSLFLLFGGNKLLALKFHNPKLETTLKWMIPYAIYVFPTMALTSILVVEGKTIKLAIFNILSILTPTGFVIVAIYYTHSYVYPTIIRIFFPLLLVPFVFRLILKNVPGKITKPNLMHMIEILKFSFPLGLASLFGAVSQQLDKVIVSFFSGPENYAYYANGAIELPLIGIITGSIGTVIMSDMSLHFQNGDKKTAIEIFRNANVKSAAILIPAMFFFLLMAKQFIIIMFSKTYINSISVFIVYLLMLPARTVFYGSAFMAMGQTKKIMYRSAISLVINAILGIVFVKILGYLGAAIASLLTLYLFLIPYNLITIGKGFDVSPLYIIPFKKVGLISIISLASLVLPILVLQFTHELSNIVNVIICFAVYVSLLFPLLLKYKLLFVPEKFLNFFKVINQ